jgi:hypothetical protein
LTKIHGLTGYTFEYKSTGKCDMGFMVDDVQAVCPEVVITKKTHRRVKYSSLVALNTEAIKELLDKVEALEARVDELEDP